MLEESAKKELNIIAEQIKTGEFPLGVVNNKSYSFLKDRVHKDWWKRLRIPRPSKKVMI